MRSIGVPELLVLFEILFLFGFAVFLVATALRGNQSRSVQRALIDKLPPNELAALLATPQGEKLMMGLASGNGSPGRAILKSIRRGIVSILSGIGLLVVRTLLGSRVDPEVPGIAILLIFIGVGVLVGALVSYRLSRRWHLLEEDGPCTPSRP